MIGSTIRALRTAVQVGLALCAVLTVVVAAELLPLEPAQAASLGAAVLALSGALAKLQNALEDHGKLAPAFYLNAREDEPSPKLYDSDSQEPPANPDRL